MEEQTLMSNSSHYNGAAQKYNGSGGEPGDGRQVFKGSQHVISAFE